MHDLAVLSGDEGCCIPPSIMPNIVAQMDAQTWTLLRDHFREHPGDVRGAADVAEVSVKAARLAFEKGGGGRPPILEVLEAERQKLLDEAYEREFAEKQKRVEAQNEEANLASLSRKNALRIGLAQTDLFDSAMTVSKEIKRRLSEHQRDGTIRDLGLGELRQLLQTCSTIGERAHRVMRMAVEIERLVSGNPIQVGDEIVAEYTPEEMEAEMQRLAMVVNNATTRYLPPPEPRKRARKGEDVE